MYQVQYKIVNNSHADYNGFENVKTAGYFEPGWGMNLLFHDTFEHFFEFSKYFSTRSLSQAGECVALGIRNYLDGHSGLIHRYAGFNTYNGVEWNSWNTILGQVHEAATEEYPIYPNDFNYTHLKAWKPHNDFEGMCEAYWEYNDEETMTPLYPLIETAFSYGDWLGHHLFHDKLSMIDDFCGNLSEFLKRTELENTDMYTEYPADVHNIKFDVDVKKSSIIGRFSNGVILKDCTDCGRSVNTWNRKLQMEYY